MKKEGERLYRRLPEGPGVYLMKDAKGRILYIGKAGNLTRRVSSYFQKGHEYRIEKLLHETKRISCKKTDTAIEALILESQLIKKYQPPYNVREKDDKSFLYVEITAEKFPRVLLVRGRAKSVGKRYGPFTSASNIRQALRILRRIFPYSIHTDVSRRRPCFEYQIGLCPGTCIGAVSHTEYQRNIKNLEFFFEGRKRQILKNLEKEMKYASEKLEFEKAEKFRRQIFALQHIQDVALITESELSSPRFPLPSYRIEGYDISNISGTSAVGSMAVFVGGKPDTDEYRKFKIRTVTAQDDIGMLREVLRRRFAHREWHLPDLILIDGGRGQVNASRRVLEESGFKIPVVGIAKGPKRKKNEFFGPIPEWANRKTLIRIRDEAHRFAIQYHKRIRHREFIEYR